MKKQKKPAKPMTVVQQLLMWGQFATGGISLISLLIFPLVMPSAVTLSVSLFIHAFDFSGVSTVPSEQFLPSMLLAFTCAALPILFAVGVKKNQWTLPAMGLLFYGVDTGLNVFLTIRLWIEDQMLNYMSIPSLFFDAFFIALFFLYFREKVLAKKAQARLVEAPAAGTARPVQICSQKAEKRIRLLAKSTEFV